MRECYIKSHENTDYIIKTFFFCTCDPDDVRDLLFFRTDRRCFRCPEHKISYQIVETKNEILASGKSLEQLSQEAAGIEFYVRKAAHMTEYCLLAISISFPLYVYGVRGIWLMLLAGFVCVGFAGLDEYHQSFVEARGPSVRDVGIDSCGAMIGILLVQAFCWSTLHTPNRKKSRKKRRNAQRRR